MKKKPPKLDWKKICEEEIKWARRHGFALFAERREHIEQIVNRHIKQEWRKK